MDEISFVGKTIASVRKDSNYVGEFIEVTFADGEKIVIQSDDTIWIEK